MADDTSNPPRFSNASLLGEEAIRLSEARFHRLSLGLLLKNTQFVSDFRRTSSMPARPLSSSSGGVFLVRIVNVQRNHETTNMAPHQTYYLKVAPMLQNPWVPDIKAAIGFPAEREAQMQKGQYKDASGVIKCNDGQYYVMKVA